MSASNRAPSSQFYWRDWLVDPAVNAMTFDERGRYFQVLARTHQTDDPGVCTEEQVRTFAEYSREEWAEHRDALARAFRIRRDGIWIQKRTVKERQAQRKRFLKSQKGGRTSATRPRDSRGRLGPRLDSDSGRGDGPPASSAASATSEGRNPTPPLPVRPPPPSSSIRERRLRGSEPAKGADRGTSGPEKIGDVMARTVALLRRGAEPDVSGFPNAVLNRLRRRYPELDVFAIAAQVRDETKSGGVRNPVGLLTARCKQLHDQAAERRAAAAPRGSSPEPNA